jgi:hypothetical protein
MFSRFSRTRAMLALVGAIGVFASGFAITTHMVSAAPAAIFSEDFNSITQTNTGTQAHTGLTLGAWDSLTGWSSSGTHAIHDVDRILGSGKDIAVSFYNNNEITLTTSFAANTSGVVYTMSFDVGPSVWSGASQASNSTDGLIVSLLRANGTTVASTTQLSGAWNGTATAQDAMTSRTFVYMGDGTGVVRIKVSNINPSADRFGGAIDNIVVTQGAPACTPVTSTSGADTVVSFKTAGLCAWTVPSTISSVQYLVVAGGGGGGGDAAGGGGAGGLLTNYGGTALNVTPSDSLIIGVGSGGVAGHNGPSNDPSGHIKPTAGGNSQFGSIVAFGGGLGGNYNSGNGGNGGSGGGGAFNNGTAGAGTSGQGNSGGNSASPGWGSGPAGGGGGGAGGVGTAGNTAQGQGGPGSSVAITGTAITYAGGGGGGRWSVNGSAPGANNGGAGGGGAGSIGCGNRATDASANTGGGGGGAPAGCYGDGGSGGSGIVIVRYTTPTAPTNSAAPVVSGTTLTGSTLSTTNGTWTGSPSSYTYQWKRASAASGSYSNISSATNNTYVLTDADIDKYIKVSVIATNSIGASSAELSAATSIVVDLADSAVPTATTPVATATGFTFTISNYSNSYTYVLTTTNGSASRSLDNVTVTGLIAGESATVTISVTRANYKPASKAVFGSAFPAPTTTTTAAPALSIVIQAPVTTIAQGQSSVATLPLTTTTVASASPKAVVTTTSTLPAVVAPTTTSTIGPPVVSKVAAGQAAVQVDGVKTAATVTRENNQMVVTSGSLSATLSGLDKAGKTAALDSDGNIHLEGGDVIKISVGGFKPKTLVEVWLFSTPTKLGSVVVGTDGTVTGAYRLPFGTKSGSHRVVVTAKMANGKSTTFTLGILVGNISKTSTLTRVLIAIPISLAIGFGFLLPNQLRRRRKIRTA